ncbi:hypothetical protein V8E51_015765 [Hyaloscypha variabilis]
MEMINHAEHATEELNLPSWAPEWIIQSKNGRWTTAEAVQNRKVSVLFEPDGCKSSHFIGVFIERAAAIMCQQLFLMYSRYPTRESAREIVRRVITCDQGWSGERSNAADGKQYTNHLLLFRSLKEINYQGTPTHWTSTSG